MRSQPAPPTKRSRPPSQSDSNGYSEPLHERHEVTGIDRRVAVEVERWIRWPAPHELQERGPKREQVGGIGIAIAVRVAEQPVEILYGIAARDSVAVGVNT